MTSEAQTLAHDEVPAASRSSFYAAMRMLPQEQRDAMYHVYAFCRAVDDVADNGGPREARMAELARYRTDIEQFYANGQTTLRTNYLARPITKFGLKKDDFIAVVDGMEMDIVRDIHAPDWATLDLYCDRAASAVGRLSVPIFGIEGELGIDLAHYLGRALQLTNILRDIDEDASLGRLYLPKEALNEGGITETEIDAILVHPALDRVCRGIAQKTRNYYRRSEALMARCPRRSARSPRMMATVYRGILEKLIARGWHAPRADVRRSKRYVLWAVLRDGIF
ncbi:squalene synthase HpnD [Hyphomicrobium denitrificans 1NES1]|uniref:Squalene synthase HpnD n=1 Tax=Hyphomicrobium denitrificans 1NES1 TaxID=670307 RepID=N0B9B5_9HYPH|nr:presqualene diphosphate synthase HpnD [Hyphomicrobium denitrificans]AGK56660.1 squalene synthase HpnD [Hyphomicrobium denitrificans 1NES1]